ncbi:MAG: RidA family protein [Parasporobacterium sp.]|nr:RidA family protein [Parasporobacterium sp.]
MQIITTSLAPAAIGPYSQGIIVGNLVYTSGQLGLDPATGEFASSTIEGQTRQSIANIEAILKEAGTDLTRVVKTTCFLQNISDFAAFNAEYESLFPGKPARSCVEAAALPKGGLVEIEVIAER